MFLTGLILVFSASEMTAEEFDAGIARVPDGLTRECLRAHLVHVLVETGEVARAEQACEAIEPLHGVDRRYLGYRIVARWFAQRGDAAGFFARWRRLAAGKERYQIDALKRTLVASVARFSGWQAAIELVADKRLGPAYRACAFQPLAEAGELEQLLALFSSGAGQNVLSEVDELGVLTRAAHCTVTENHSAVARDSLTQILNRVIALDPAEKPVMRARDQMLLSLWPAYPDAQTLALARKSARTPSIRSELTVLYSDMTRPC